jgi:hypothetical protein
MPEQSLSVKTALNHWVIILPDQTMFFRQMEQQNSSPHFLSMIL